MADTQLSHIIVGASAGPSVTKPLWPNRHKVHLSTTYKSRCADNDNNGIHLPWIKVRFRRTFRRGLKIHHQFHVLHETRIRMICCTIYFLKVFYYKSAERKTNSSGQRLTRSWFRAAKKTTTGRIFVRLNFFNFCEAGGADRLNRFGRGQRRSITNFTYFIL